MALSSRYTHQQRIEADYHYRSIDALYRDAVKADQTIVAKGLLPILIELNGSPADFPYKGEYDAQLESYAAPVQPLEPRVAGVSDALPLKLGDKLKVAFRAYDTVFLGEVSSNDEDGVVIDISGDSKIILMAGDEFVVSMKDDIQLFKVEHDDTEGVTFVAVPKPEDPTASHEPDSSIQPGSSSTDSEVTETEGEEAKS